VPNSEVSREKQLKLLKNKLSFCRPILLAKGSIKLSYAARNMAYKPHPVDPVVLLVPRLKPQTNLFSPVWFRGGLGSGLGKLKKASGMLLEFVPGSMPDIPMVSPNI